VDLVDKWVLKEVRLEYLSYKNRFPEDKNKELQFHELY